jgi:putative redox protein
MYARRKEWPLYEVSVHLDHDRVFPEDCEFRSAEGVQTAPPAVKVEVIRRHISVRGDLTGEQVQRLLEIADRCPVHRTLQDPPRVHTTIVSGV